jgi:hypothetical protein
MRDGRINITQHHDGELWDIFSNDEGLYRSLLRCHSIDNLKALTSDYKYTRAQWSEFKTDWQDTRGDLS